MGKIFFLITIISFITKVMPLSAWSMDYDKDEDTAVFSGRISRLSQSARLMRVRVDFKNAKFLKGQDRIQFWNDTYPDRRCRAYLESKSNRYLLMKVPHYEKCLAKVKVTVGTYLRFYSEDLEKNINIAKDLMVILNKKRMALSARLKRYEKEMTSYIEKIDTVNKRYEILRQKMELEWQQELSALEEDKTKSYMNYKNSQTRLNELDHKIQQYRVQDQNLYEDRWSLDPKLYLKK